MYRTRESSPDPPLEPAKVRKGRFLWMDPPEQHRYLEALARRISAGYYFSDKILGEIVDEIAPIVEENVEQELSPG